MFKTTALSLERDIPNDDEADHENFDATKVTTSKPLLQSYNILMEEKLQLQNLQALSSLVHAKELKDVVVA